MPRLHLVDHIMTRIASPELFYGSSVIGLQVVDPDDPTVPEKLLWLG